MLSGACVCAEDEGRTAYADWLASPLVAVQCANEAARRCTPPNGFCTPRPYTPFYSSTPFACSYKPQHGNSQGLWQSSDKAAAPFLEALDVLIKRSSWDESIVSLLLMPVIIGLRHTGAWLPRARNWLLARRSLKSR